MPSSETTPPSRKDGPASEINAATTSSHSNANTTNSKYTKETPRKLEINKPSKKTSSPGEMVSETSPATNAAAVEAEETVVASNMVS